LTDLKSGPELDALVAERVMGWGLWDGPGYPEGRSGLYLIGAEGQVYKTSPPDGSWSPSTNIAPAWEVVERLENTGFYWKFVRHSDGLYLTFSQPPVLLEIADAQISQWDKLPHAICLAALKAVGG